MDSCYAPAEPTPFDRQTPLVPPWHDEIPSRLDPFSRDDCALLIDFYLRRLVSLKNRIDPGLAAGLARVRSGAETPLWECAEYMAAEALEAVMGLGVGNETGTDVRPETGGYEPVARGQAPGAITKEDRDRIRADIESEYDNWSFLSWAPVAVRLGSARVRLLEPLARQIWPCDWAAWIERAEDVTVRRLADETNWAIDFGQRDQAGWAKRKGAPPAPGEGPYARVDGKWNTSSCGKAPCDGERHTCSGDGAAGGDSAPGLSPGATSFGPGLGDPPLTSLIRFSAPPESAGVWQRALGACRRLAGVDAPAWHGLALIVDHFLEVWAPENDPDNRTAGYPSAVFQRDGWRCTVPGCHARTNLTPHHVIRRSRGGGNEMANLTTVCWSHHLEGIHRGLVSVSGRAPDQLVWELGPRSGEPPVLAASGDRVLARSAPGRFEPPTLVGFPHAGLPHAAVPVPRDVVLAHSG